MNTNVLNGHKIFQMAIKYKLFPIEGPSKLISGNPDSDHMYESTEKKQTLTQHSLDCLIDFQRIKRCLANFWPLDGSKTWCPVVSYACYV
jgi:hypothetical protein